jgi:hypothetical protein
VATLAAAILTAGAWLGQTWVRQAPAPSPAPAAPPVTRTVTKAVVPATCLTALRRGDATVRLLKGNVRDGRLDKAIKAYQKVAGGLPQTGRQPLTPDSGPGGAARARDLGAGVHGLAARGRLAAPPATVVMRCWRSNTTTAPGAAPPRRS